MTAPTKSRMDLDCADCGLTIHTGDDVLLGRFGWVHPLCYRENDGE